MKKTTLLLLLSFMSILGFSQKTLLIKNGGIADLKIIIKESGLGDIKVLFKEFGDVDIRVGITYDKSKANFILKHSGFGDRSIILKDGGIGDISILIKESGFGDVSIGMRESGFVDYLIYSDNNSVTRGEIVAALIDVVKEKANKG